MSKTGFKTFFCLLSGALANPYLREYGSDEDGSPVYGSPERQPRHDIKFRSHQPNLASNKQPSTSISKNVISSMSNEMKLPEDYRILGRTPSSYSNSRFLHPSRYPKIAQTDPIPFRGERNPKESKRDMNNIFTSEGSKYARLRNALGGFNQNAPGSLYPSDPLKPKVSVPFVYTVPYSSINEKYSVGDQFQNNHLPKQSTHFIEPKGSYHLTPKTNLQYPSQTLMGLQDPTGTPYVSPVSLKESLASTFPNAVYHKRSSPKMTQGQGTQIRSIRASQRLVSSNSVPVIVSVGSLEKWATTKGQGRELHPFTENLPTANSPPAENGDGPSGSIGGEAFYQSFKKEHKDTKDLTQASQLRPKIRYLVSAFNHYEQGRVYQSHGSNDPREVFFPFGDETQQLQVQSDGNQKNSSRK